MLHLDTQDPVLDRVGGALTPEADVDRAASADEMSSSSTSEFCSSSDSSSSDGEFPAGDRATGSGQAPRRRRVREDGPDEGLDHDPDAPPVTRQRREQTFEWRGFRFTCRPAQANKKASYMVLCRQ